VLVLGSCTIEIKPEDVVKYFFAAIETKDFDKAKSLATSESSSMINMMEKAATLTSDEDME
jgi:hypothetical protein